MGGRGGRIRVGVLASAVALVIVLGACKPLREYPAAKSMFFGTAARASELSDPAYANTLAREFGGLVPENELKWETIHPGPDTYNFAPADALVNFARSHDMVVRGVPLLWHNQNPPWLQSTAFTAAQLSNILWTHIVTVVGRYRGRIIQWDVVNEPFNDNGTLRNTVWRKIGRRYMDQAFTTAREVDPGAKLFLNEHGIERPSAKADAVFQEVSRMRSRGVPIDGVGFQMHATTSWPTAQELTAQIARYAAIGVEVAITEMDVQLTLPATSTDIQVQARLYHDALAVCRAAPNCNTFVVWGFTDRFSWIPFFFAGQGSATIMDQQYSPKPAYDMINQHLANAG